MDHLPHRIVDVSGLVGRDRTPWGSPRVGVRRPGDTLEIRDALAPSTSAQPDDWAPPAPARCECADVRAWLGPRRPGPRKRIR